MFKDEFYKNKLKNLDCIVNEWVLCYLVIDYYSGVFFLCYYFVLGENIEIII